MMKLTGSMLANVYARIMQFGHVLPIFNCPASCLCIREDQKVILINLVFISNISALDMRVLNASIFMGLLEVSNQIPHLIFQ